MSIWQWTAVSSHQGASRVSFSQHILSPSSISINTFAKINFHICALQTSWVRIFNSSSRTVDHQPERAWLDCVLVLVFNLLTANTSHVFLSPELFSIDYNLLIPLSFQSPGRDEKVSRVFILKLVFLTECFLSRKLQEAEAASLQAATTPGSPGSPSGERGRGRGRGRGPGRGRGRGRGGTPTWGWGSGRCGGQGCWQPPRAQPIVAEPRGGSTPR